MHENTLRKRPIILRAIRKFAVCSLQVCQVGRHGNNPHTITRQYSADSVCYNRCVWNNKRTNPDDSSQHNGQLERIVTDGYLLLYDCSHQRWYCGNDCQLCYFVCPRVYQTGSRSFCRFVLVRVVFVMYSVLQSVCRKIDRKSRVA